MVDGWDAGHMFPYGHYVTSLGPVGEVGVGCSIAAFVGALHGAGSSTVKFLLLSY